METLLRRKRWLRFAGSKVARRKGASDRIAVNTICQGSAADLVKAVMVDLASHPSFCGPTPEARLVLQIHDELLIEVRKESLHAVARTVAEIMSIGNRLRLSVDLPVKLHWGTTWACLQPL